LAALLALTAVPVVNPWGLCLTDSLVFTHVDAVPENGVPESAMTPGYTGCGTPDSVVCAKGRARSTEPRHRHAWRAAFAAHQHDANAIIFCPEKIPVRWSVKPRVREWARA
jgi:vancomycin permeability regulator SanA